jgi:peptide/bleomycin uptake transporter
MFRFFYDRKWWPWSIGGTIVIVIAVWYSVQLDVQINEWFGRFYDALQKALSTPGALTIEEFNEYMYEFFSIAASTSSLVVIFNGFLVNHWTFRWRQYRGVLSRALGKSEIDRRCQPARSRRYVEICTDYRRFRSRSPGNHSDAFAFIPILYGLSKNVTELPIIGPVDHGLVWVVLLTAIGGTVVLGLVGSKLPGIEYDIQKNEAAYRKELVLGEDDATRAKPDQVDFLFDDVRKIHFKAYLHYFYFNMAKWSYLQGMVIVPYFALGPTIITGAITLGVVSQTVRAMGKVAESLQYIIRSWLKIVELVSVYKRLREFERRILAAENTTLET